MDEHSRLAPSSAPVFRFCHGSPAMQEAVKGIVPVDEAAADEGTCGHTVGEVLLAYMKLGTPIQDYQIIDRVYEGVVVTAEMFKYVSEYVEAVRATAMMAGGLDTLELELKVHAASIHELAYGTGDAFIYDEKRKHLHVFDLKYGYGIVEPDENFQLLTYAVGKWEELHAEGKIVETVTLGIVQPRAWHDCGHIRTWTTSAGRLIGHYINELRDAYNGADTPGAQLTAGEHCTNCEALMACPAYRRSTLAGIDIVTDQWVEMPSVEQIATELDLLRAIEKRIENRKEAIESLGEIRIREGKVIPGYEMGRGRGGRVWKDERHLSVMGLALGVKLTKEVPLTPAQAEIAGLPKDVVKSLAQSIPGKMKLKPDTSEARAKQAFK